MIRPSDAPRGFTVETGPQGTLLAQRDHVDALRQAGLAACGGWNRLLAQRAASGPGRAATARLALAGGPTLVLKQMRRGGIAAPLWKERFAGHGRLLRNLTLPLEVAARGLSTARPVALLLVEGPRGLFRGWLATEEIRGAQDLISCFGSSEPPTRVELGAVVDFVRRMHDAGLEHRDLNLGNLLLRRRSSEIAEVFVIDLDGARLHARPLAFGLRQRALRRLERSYEKCVVSGDAPGRPPGDWYELYAAADPLMAARFQSGRTAARIRLFLHRLGWRR